ncbi:hypothetical protein FNT36_05785 [Hymenobacter setariae]|uniref:STAS/SEC14 domain-containing protein n=1 Tax=Hymenobacter setariae TaxID=2594794 RepID=A0A558C481_9BACT|nr:hypothetical protein [Hymenobacter setariae]TVT43595.1 hypothetical protein FNT36_05785 [Hymenobacter setariae]
MLTSTVATVFTNAVGTIEAHPQGYAIVRYHPGMVEIPALQELLMHLGQLLLQRGWRKVLVDSRELTVFRQEVKDWTRANWIAPVIPRPHELVLATLLPNNVFGRLAMAELQLSAASGNLNLNFDDEAAAHAYLGS